MAPLTATRFRLGWRGAVVVLAGAAWALLAGCSSSAGPALEGPRRYTLVGFNQEDVLPTTFADAYTVLSGSLVLRADGSCAKRLEWRIEADPPVTNDGTNRCVWSQAGDMVELVVQLEDGEEMFSGRITKWGLELTVLDASQVQCAAGSCPPSLVERYELG